jgi:hypothetical protein
MLGSHDSASTLVAASPDAIQHPSRTLLAREDELASFGDTIEILGQVSGTPPPENRQIYR